jgi:hypothetical protein
MLLEHPWLLPLSPSRPDFAQVEETNKQMLGEWVTNTIAMRNADKEADVDDDSDRKPKPPLHTVNKEPST